MVISAAIEAEVAQLTDEAEKAEFLSIRSASSETGLDARDPRRLRAARPHHLLHRRAEGSARLDRAPRRQAPEAAGVIHTDFERGFIRAETIAYDDFVAHGGEAGARDAGKLRSEGKDYVVQDGDVLHFRFNV